MTLISRAAADPPPAAGILGGCIFRDGVTTESRGLQKKMHKVIHHRRCCCFGGIFLNHLRRIRTAIKITVQLTKAVIRNTDNFKDKRFSTCNWTKRSICIPFDRIEARDYTFFKEAEDITTAN
jgi:hypothetical protein